MTILKKPTISGKIVSFLKIVGEIQQLVRKRSQKINYDVVLHYISIPICPLLFPKFCPIKKHKKSLRNCRYLVKNDPHRLSNFLQTHIFWNFDHISRIYNQINYTNIWFPKVIIILIMTAQVLFSMFFPKKTRNLMPLRLLTDFQFRIKLILANEVTWLHSKSTRNFMHSLFSTLWV